MSRFVATSEQAHEAYGLILQRRWTTDKDGNAVSLEHFSEVLTLATTTSIAVEDQPSLLTRMALEPCDAQRIDDKLARHVSTRRPADHLPTVLLAWIESHGKGYVSRGQGHSRQFCGAPVLRAVTEIGFGEIGFGEMSMSARTAVPFACAAGEGGEQRRMLI